RTRTGSMRKPGPASGAGLTPLSKAACSQPVWKNTRPGRRTAHPCFLDPPGRYAVHGQAFTCSYKALRKYALPALLSRAGRLPLIEDALQRKNRFLFSQVAVFPGISASPIYGANGVQGFFVSNLPNKALLLAKSLSMSAENSAGVLVLPSKPSDVIFS